MTMLQIVTKSDFSSHSVSQWHNHKWWSVLLFSMVIQPLHCMHVQSAVSSEGNYWCFSSFLPLLCLVCRQACYMPSVMPAICYHHGGVYYVYHIDYCEVYLNGGGMHGKNVLNYPLPASYSVIEPVLACHICSHCCINWKLLRVIFLYLSLYFYLFACYTTAIRAT